ncbi:MAG TPA: hypothetical protein VIL88_05775 [Devosia sp.]|jgi:hypothetical protein|uniref:DUF6894 family protein n=1 Tax=Devosia sp. TaxID=1871048 RepID=UPI002F95256B
MPKYFFHVTADQHCHDINGSECSDDDDAVKQALLAGTEMIRDFGRRSMIGQVWEMLVQDDDGRNIFTLSLKGTVLAAA